MDATAGTLSDPRQRFLGSKAVKLFRIQVQDKRGVSLWGTSAMYHYAGRYEENRSICVRALARHCRRLFFSLALDGLFPRENNEFSNTGYQSLYWSLLIRHLDWPSGFGAILEVVAVVQLSRTISNDAAELRSARPRGGVLYRNVSGGRCGGVGGKASHFRG